MRTLAVFLMFAACLPAAAQQNQATQPSQPPLRGPVVIAIPEHYPAFDPAAREAHPEAVELYAVIDYGARLDPESDANTTVVLLSPEHVDAATLRAALVAVHNHRARGPREDAPLFRVIGETAAGSPVPAPARGILNGTLDAVRSRPLTELAHYGQVRFVTVADPSAALRPPHAGRAQ